MSNKSPTTITNNSASSMQYLYGLFVAALQKPSCFDSVQSFILYLGPRYQDSISKEELEGWIAFYEFCLDSRDKATMPLFSKLVFDKRMTLFFKNRSTRIDTGSKLKENIELLLKTSSNDDITNNSNNTGSSHHTIQSIDNGPSQSIDHLILCFDIPSCNLPIEGELTISSVITDLDRKNILAPAVRKRLLTRRVITLDSSNHISYELEKIITDVDTFGEFNFDLFQGILNVSLERPNRVPFPKQWYITENSKIEKRLKITVFRENQIQEQKSQTPQPKTLQCEKSEQYLEYILQNRTTSLNMVDLKSWIENVCSIHGKFNRREEVLNMLLNQGVDTVDDLKKWTSLDWEKNSSWFPINYKKIIRKELENIKTNDETTIQLTNQISLAELYGKLHAIKRYFYYHCGKINEIPLLDEKAIDEAFSELDYNGKELLNDIKERFFKIFEYSNEKNVKIPKGLLLYGPPGTGKTQISGSLPKLVGLIEVVPALASTEVNRSLVGETEKILLDLCSRAHKIPHLAACIAIDEIDALAPKRNSESSGQSKKDALSILLAVLGGIKNVPNILFLASTNLRNEIDEAFLRRLRGQFFVGRPNPESREEFFKDLSFKMSDIVKNDLVAITTNFTGAALKELVSDITVRLKSKRMNDLDLQTSRKCAALICEQFPSLLLGKYNLPELFMRSSSSASTTTIQCEFNKDADYTGRIVIDLSGESCILEYVSDKKSHLLDVPILFECLPGLKARRGEGSQLVLHSVSKKRVNSSSILPFFATFAKERNIDFIQMIDLNVLMRNNAFDDKQIKGVLNERMEELEQYNRTLVIFDLDSLVGVSMNQSDSNMGLSKSRSIHNVGTFITLIHYFMDSFYSKDNSKMRWSAIVSSHSFLLESFREATNFIKCYTENAHEMTMIENMKERKCLCCETVFNPEENEKNANGCEYHPGFLYDAKNLCSKVNPEQVQEYNVTRGQDSDLIYICCSQKYGTKGCQKSRHSCEINVKNECAKSLSVYYDIKCNNLFKECMSIRNQSIRK